MYVIINVMKQTNKGEFIMNSVLVQILFILSSFAILGISGFCIYGAYVFSDLNEED